MMPSELETEMRKLLASMSVLSEVDASTLGDKIHGGEHHRAPKGPNAGMYDEWLAAWNNANGPIARQRVYDAADAAFKAHRCMRIPEGQDPAYGSPLWKRWVAENPEPAEEIARKFNVSRRYIRNIREAYAAE